MEDHWKGKAWIWKGGGGGGLNWPGGVFASDVAGMHEVNAGPAILTFMHPSDATSNVCQQAMPFLTTCIGFALHFRNNVCIWVLRLLHSLHKLQDSISAAAISNWVCWRDLLCSYTSEAENTNLHHIKYRLHREGYHKRMLFGPYAWGESNNTSTNVLPWLIYMGSFWVCLSGLIGVTYIWGII